MAEIAAIARPYAEAAFAVAVGDGGVAGAGDGGVAGDGGLSRHPRSPLSGGGGGDGHGHGDAGDGDRGGDSDGGVAGAGDGGVAARVDAWSAFLARAAAVVGDAQVAQLLHNPRADKNRVLALIADIAIGDGDGHGHGDAGDGDADSTGTVTDESTVAHQRNLLKLLAANGRLPALPAIYARFEHLRAEAESTVDAELVTALPVGESQQRAIAESLSRKLGRQVRLTAREDADLIGGAIVRAGDTVIDASVRGQLAQLAGALDA